MPSRELRGLTPQFKAVKSPQVWCASARPAPEPARLADSASVTGYSMATAQVRSLAEQIRALPEDDRQAFAQEVLPDLLRTRAGLQVIDQALGTLSDEEVDALIERARALADLPEATAAVVIGEAVRAVRAQSRS